MKKSTHQLKVWRDRRARRIGARSQQHRGRSHLRTKTTEPAIRIPGAGSVSNAVARAFAAIFRRNAGEREQTAPHPRGGRNG